MEPMPTTVDVEEDYTSYLIYNGQGFTVHENHDKALDSTWFTVIIERPTTRRVADAMAYFMGMEAEVIETEFDGENLYIDVDAE